VRVEANASRIAERLTGQVLSRQGVSAGFSGQVARDTYVSIDCHVGHTPLPTISGNPWVTRSMIRMTRSFPFGAPRASAVGGLSPPARALGRNCRRRLRRLEWRRAARSG
jgi:hypothetical protein